MALSTGADTPQEITHGFVLKGFDLVYSMLSGECDESGSITASKHIENRHCRMAPGWYAVVCGKGTKGVTKQRYDKCRSILSSMFVLDWGDENVKHMMGKVVGIARIAHSLPYELCRNDPWAEGPVCNIISHVAWFVSGVACRGNFGAFPLAASALDQVRYQANTAHIRATKGPEMHPYRDAAVWLNKKRKKDCLDMSDKDDVAVLRNFLISTRNDIERKVVKTNDPGTDPGTDPGAEGVSSES